jgi:hypothetical protein
VLLLQFSQKQPKVNSHPIGENSPNLIILIVIEMQGTLIAIPFLPKVVITGRKTNLQFLLTTLVRLFFSKKKVLTKSDEICCM